MAVALRIIEPPQVPDGYQGVIRHIPGGSLEGQVAAGDMWREPSLDRDGREAWMITLPSLDVWCTTDAVPVSGMWDVTGEPPVITVNPSINCMGENPWHGFIRDGELRDA